jgi:hypothetical protein
VGYSKRNSFCSNIKKFSKSGGIMNVTKTSHMEKVCCKKCGIVLCAIRTLCDECCEMAGSISKKMAVVQMYAGIMVKYSHQIVCLNSILKCEGSNAVDDGEERTGRKNNMWNMQLEICNKNLVE